MFCLVLSVCRGDDEMRRASSMSKAEAVNDKPLSRNRTASYTHLMYLDNHTQIDCIGTFSLS